MGTSSKFKGAKVGIDPELKVVVKPLILPGEELISDLIESIT